MMHHLRLTRRFCTKVHNSDAAIRIYSCRFREKVPLQLPSPARITSFYTCGPTVYDSAHIGHASCYVRLDILQRILKDHFGLRLVTAMNITDIDDKIIRRAAEVGKPWTDIARHYEQEFWTDLQRLNVRPPDIKLRVTDHIPRIVAFIEQLIAKNYAYKSSDGSVYFETANYPQYGKLQNIPTEQQSSPESKKSAADFALWKAAKPGEPSWPSPFGLGRPGWHIECSTLATQIFGRQLDFHAGGLDLRFPHHENEEAQSCCYHGVDDWVHYWIHTGQLHLEGQTHKMSKSLKNTVSIGELMGKYSADEFRMLCLLSHYRSVIEFGDDSMTVATNVLKKFRSFFGDCRAYVEGVKPAGMIDSGALHGKVQEVDEKIEEFLRNDFNTASVVTSLGDLASTVNKSINQGNSGDAAIVASESGVVQAMMNYIRGKLTLFGLLEFDEERKISSGSGDGHSIEQVIESMVQIRGAIRVQAMDSKDRRLFAICDQIRDRLKEVNVEIKDHGKSSSWSYVKR
ncbi:probable cysteine--tRNA ligase, mitochondrial [Aedes aegypti]|uniref:Cysteine--tRNA ligase n=1 Tax=Aedes aegypti TaxID=7159 RepID=A0A6I8U1X3_AEDAE|nr:probable cysteine--tRNA ligase, mitochondrial [Aedes aegypti]